MLFSKAEISLFINPIKSLSAFCNWVILSVSEREEFFLISLILTLYIGLKPSIKSVFAFKLKGWLEFTITDSLEETVVSTSDFTNFRPASFFNKSASFGFWLNAEATVESSLFKLVNNCLSKFWSWFNFSDSERAAFEFIWDTFSLYEELIYSIKFSFAFESNGDVKFEETTPVLLVIVFSLAATVISKSERTVFKSFNFIFKEASAGFFLISTSVFEISAATLLNKASSNWFNWVNFSISDKDLFEFNWAYFSLYSEFIDSTKFSFFLGSNSELVLVTLVSIEDSLEDILPSISDLIAFKFSNLLTKETFAGFSLIEVSILPITSFIEANNSLSKFWNWINFSDSDNELFPLIWLNLSLYEEFIDSIKFSFVFESKLEDFPFFTITSSLEDIFASKSDWIDSKFFNFDNNSGSEGFAFNAVFNFEISVSNEDKSDLSSCCNWVNLSNSVKDELLFISANLSSYEEFIDSTKSDFPFSSKLADTGVEEVPFFIITSSLVDILASKSVWIDSKFFNLDNNIGSVEFDLNASLTFEISVSKFDNNVLSNSCNWFNLSTSLIELLLLIWDFLSSYEELNDSIKSSFPFASRSLISGFEAVAFAVFWFSVIELTSLDEATSSEFSSPSGKSKAEETNVLAFFNDSIFWINAGSVGFAFKAFSAVKISFLIEDNISRSKAFNLFAFSSGVKVASALILSDLPLEFVTTEPKSFSKSS